MANIVAPEPLQSPLDEQQFRHAGLPCSSASAPAHGATERQAADLTLENLTTLKDAVVSAAVASARSFFTKFEAIYLTHKHKCMTLALDAKTFVALVCGIIVLIAALTIGRRRNKAASRRSAEDGQRHAADDAALLPLPLLLERADRIAEDMLRRHKIDPARGFLPEKDPLQSLGPGFDDWERLAAAMPDLLRCRKLRAAVRDLPLLSARTLKDYPSQRRGLLLLSALAHGFVWEDPDSPADTIPPQLAVPLVDVAARVGVPPVLTHCSVVLANWRRLDPSGPLDTGNLACLQHFLGGMDEAWFFLLTVEIERVGAPALRHIVVAQLIAQYLQRLPPGAAERLETCLRGIGAAVRAMRDTFRRMPDGCDPHIFFHRVRPWLAAWKRNPRLPHGVLYSGASSERQFYAGGSAAQSTLPVAIDVALGVRWPAGSIASFMAEMRTYMPRPHRRFLEALEAGTSIRGVVDARKDQLPRVAVAFDAAARDVLAFRATHLHIVREYILKQAAATTPGSAGPQAGASGEARAVGSEHGAAAANDGVGAAQAKGLSSTAGGKGTGGSDLLSFLTPLHEATKEAMVGGRRGGNSAAAAGGGSGGGGRERASAAADGDT